MSENTFKKRKITSKKMLLSFYEINSIIKSGDSIKLKELIKEGRIDDIDMTRPHCYSFKRSLSIWIYCMCRSLARQRCGCQFSRL